MQHPFAGNQRPESRPDCSVWSALQAWRARFSLQCFAVYASSVPAEQLLYRLWPKAHALETFCNGSGGIISQVPHLWAEQLGAAKVDQLEVAVSIQHQVLRLQVTVDDLQHIELQ